MDIQVPMNPGESFWHVSTTDMLKSILFIHTVTDYGEKQAFNIFFQQKIGAGVLKYGNESAL